MNTSRIHGKIIAFLRSVPHFRKLRYFSLSATGRGQDFQPLDFALAGRTIQKSPLENTSGDLSTNQEGY